MSLGSETSDMTSEGLGEMFEGDSADTCARKLPLMSMGGRAEGLACADPGVRPPIGVSGNFIVFFFTFSHFSTIFVSLYYLCFSNFGL